MDSVSSSAYCLRGVPKKIHQTASYLSLISPSVGTHLAENASYDAKSNNAIAMKSKTSRKRLPNIATAERKRQSTEEEIFE